MFTRGSPLFFPMKPRAPQDSSCTRAAHWALQGPRDQCCCQGNRLACKTMEYSDEIWWDMMRYDEIWWVWWLKINVMCVFNVRSLYRLHVEIAKAEKPSYVSDVSLIRWLLEIWNLVQIWKLPEDTGSRIWLRKWGTSRSSIENGKFWSGTMKKILINHGNIWKHMETQLSSRKMKNPDNHQSQTWHCPNNRERCISRSKTHPLERLTCLRLHWKFQFLHVFSMSRNEFSQGRSEVLPIYLENSWKFLKFSFTNVFEDGVMTQCLQTSANQSLFAFRRSKPK
jgi:hypothetical protein